MSLKQLGIDASVVVRAMEDMEHRASDLNNRSKKVYVIHPEYDEIFWDIKELLRAAAEVKGVSLRPDFITNTYKRHIPGLGLKYLEFKSARHRVLGIAGHDIRELQDEHVVVGAYGEVANWYTSYAFDPSKSSPIFYETKVRRYHQAWERRGVDSSKIKAVRGFKCEGCGLEPMEKFGEDIGASCLDAHHIKPVSEMPPAGRETNIDDFLVLCANCHRLIHRLKSPDDIAGLKSIVAS